MESGAASKWPLELRAGRRLSLDAGLQAKVRSASGAHVLNVRCAPVLANPVFRLGLKRNTSDHFLPRLSVSAHLERASRTSVRAGRGERGDASDRTVVLP